MDGARRAQHLRQRVGAARARRRGDPGRRALRASRRTGAEPRGGRGRARSGARRAVAVAPPLHHRHVGLGDPGRPRRSGRDAGRGRRTRSLRGDGLATGPVRPLVRFQPTNGISDQVFHIFVADGATYVGDPTDASESDASNGSALPICARSCRTARCSTACRSPPCCTPSRSASSTNYQSSGPRKHCVGRPA